LHSGGIVGNVTLQSRPRGAHVSDVFVKPSVRKKQLGVDVELSGVTQSGPVQFVARLLDEKGREEKRFTQTVNVAAAPTQRVQIAWPWSNPRLWDLNQPNLYTLRLSARGAGWMTSRFKALASAKCGRRVAWFILTGRRSAFVPFCWHQRAEGNKRIAEARELGYNFGELWPEDVESRSRDASYTGWYDVADREGFRYLASCRTWAGWAAT
jgi:hypothetical protein